LRACRCGSRLSGKRARPANMYGSDMISFS
jgi:hypothetical protein